MIINPISFNNNIKKPSFNKKKSLDELSGIKQLDSYFQKIKQDNIKKYNEEKQLEKILEASIEPLYSQGKYKAAKVIADELREKSPYEPNEIFSLILGNINQKNGDIVSANKFFSNSYKQTTNDQFALKLEAFKNLADTSIMLGHNPTETIEPFAKENNPYLNMVYLYLHSLIESKNGSPQKALNDISLSYKKMKDKNLTDDKIIYQLALALSDNDMFDESNSVLNERLQQLQDNKLIYTKEFLDYLLLLGINMQKNPNEKNYEKTIATLYNAANIAIATNQQQSLEIANYSIVKILFDQKDSNFTEFANKILPSIKNPNIQIKINLLVGDKLSNNSPKEALRYYEKAWQIIKKEKENGKETELEKPLSEIYDKLKQVAPEMEEKINEEITNDGRFDILDAPKLSLSFVNDIIEKNTPFIREKANFILSASAATEINKQIAKVYIVFANMIDGIDYNTAVNDSFNQLEKLASIVNKNEKKNNLQKVLYDAYKIQSGFLLETERYELAAKSVNKADQYFNEKEYNNELKAKHKIITTLYNYKAKDYYTAEKYALEYLNTLLNTELKSTSPKVITSDVNKKLAKMNDTQKRKIASAYETLGLINLKREDFPDAAEYFLCAVDIREKMKNKDIELANSYAALARIAMLTKLTFLKNWKSFNQLSSKEMHQKSLEILERKYPNSKILQEEKEFHKKYYGNGLASASKYILLRPSRKEEIINKFHCYNKELNICE